MRKQLLGIGVLGLIAALGPAASALAGPAGPSGVDLGKGNVGYAASASAVTASGAMSGPDYWTPERMAAAKPAEISRSSTPSASASASASVARGKPAGYPPSGGSGVSAGGVSLLSTAVARPYTNPPDRLNGKVYFKKYTSGGAFVGNYVCSGTSVNSPGKSLVWTAGHCVHGGPGYGAHRDWIFVPAFSSSYDGHEPYKKWYAKELWTKTAWAADGNISYDVGAAIVWRTDNVRLTEKIGGQGIWFNSSQTQIYSAYGYPAAAPFDGNDQIRCVSGLLDTDDPDSGPDTSKINCNMTGGASGGGWLINVDSAGWGRVNSVNSYKYPGEPNNVYGPYHGESALNLFDFVKDKTA